MREPSSDAHAGRLPAGARIFEVAAQVEHGSRPYAVVDDEGTIVGEVDRETIVNVFMDQRGEAS